MSCQSPPRISDIQSIEAIEFRQAMRNLASGVSIVATGTAVRRRGLTVSSITSICMEPPCLLVCINASSETHDAILANGTFGVSLLGGNQQDLALRFAGRHLSTVSIQRHGIRAFLTYRFCKAQFVCSNASCITTNSSAPMGIFIGRIVATRSAQGNPLVNFRGELRTLLYG
ncbi:flavin reductase family protein [Bradyrhizobium algeriense]|uniref:flavin reductase family protein n=1 Tax=Bradyrhizobium algeriense TaxID=634784 RepID=UPI000D34B8BC|nr:flavin reductase family protein [Bradyrhizobium algeriense]